MKPTESFVAQPVRSLQTMLRVIAKDDSRMLLIVPDGIYGADTSAAITTFQRLYGLPQTGITDQQTWDNIVAVYSKSIINIDKGEPIEILLNPGQEITAGETGPYVYLAQAMLAYISAVDSTIPIPPNSGIMDEETMLAITAIQEISGLEPTGIIDKTTWLHLSNLFTLFVHKEERK